MRFVQNACWPLALETKNNEKHIIMIKHILKVNLGLTAVFHKQALYLTFFS